MKATKKPVVGILLKFIDEEGTREKLQVGKSYQFITSEQYTSYLLPYTEDICFIKPNLTKQEISSILSKINGVLLPGGLSDVYVTNGTTTHESEYTKAVRIILEEAIQINNNGTIFPVFGICLGFEAMIAAMSSKPIISKCINCWNYNTSVMLNKVIESPLLNLVGKDAINLLQNRELTYNTHNYMITPEDLAKNCMAEGFYNILGTSISDDKKTTFISMIEGKKYPVFGVQFHPELCMNKFYSDSIGLKPILNDESKYIGNALIKSFISYCYKNDNCYSKCEAILLSEQKASLIQIPEYNVRCYVAI